MQQQKVTPRKINIIFVDKLFFSLELFLEIVNGNARNTGELG